MGEHTDCIFCKIAAGRIPATMLYEDERVMVFQDIHPQAPVHLLVVPRKHIADVDGVAAEDRELMGDLFRAAARVAAERGFAGAGYKLVVNNGAAAGQVVFHLHVHVLSGRRFTHVAV
jgi:histidine triad (HIT) family protein